MKILTPFLLALISGVCFSQNLSVASADTDPAALYVRASQSLTAGDSKLAEEIFKQVIQFYKKEGRVKEVPESYLGMALAFAFNGDYEQSIRFHRMALRAHHRYRCDESDDAIRFNLGLTYQLAGKDKKAKRYLASPNVFSSRD